MRLPLLMALVVAMLGGREASAGERRAPLQAARQLLDEASAGGDLTAPRAPAPGLLDVTLRSPLVALFPGLDDELLDEGGGGRGFQGAFPAAFIALFIGLGAAHAIADDRDGALLWLGIDAGVLVVAITAGAVTGLGLVWLGGLVALVTERIFQARSAVAASRGFDPVDDGNNRFDDDSEKERRSKGDDGRLDGAGPSLPASTGVTLLRAAF